MLWCSDYINSQLSNLEYVRKAYCECKDSLLFKIQNLLHWFQKVGFDGLPRSAQTVMMCLEAYMFLIFIYMGYQVFFFSTADDAILTSCEPILVHDHVVSH